MQRETLIILFLLFILAGVLAVPFLLKPQAEASRPGARMLVILSPHNEAVRYEFDRAFREWHERCFGEALTIDWRNVGGTSEIVRYLDSEYAAAAKVSQPGIGIDLFFGGGQYDHARQAAAGQVVPCGLRARHPEWLIAEIIPNELGGVQFYDPDDRWYGCCLSTFGICYNEDILRVCGLEQPPRRWIDLTDFRYFRQVALADPSKSGSINKAFEMLIQEQMAAQVLAAQQAPARASPEVLAAGWRQAMQVIQQISANARYFTDAAGKVPTDVSQGDAAAGMCIDYYGRFESETVRRNEKSDRMRYLTPLAGSSVSVDPISLLRGAPQPALAERFIDFCLSPEGQKLWNYRLGEPGGPMRYALRRLPVRRDMYSANHLKHMSDPNALPYSPTELDQAADANFIYQPAWTEPLFGLIRALIRAMCIDTHTELVAAWAAIHHAGGPAACPQAMRALGTLPANGEYIEAKAKTSHQLADKLEEARLMRQWIVFFRAHYQEAKMLAERAAAGKI